MTSSAVKSLPLCHVTPGRTWIVHFVASAFGVTYERPTDDAALEKALRRALEGDGPALIEVRPADARP